MIANNRTIMPTRHRHLIDPVPVVWVAFSITAATLAATAPIWTVALCVPAAGLLTRIITRHRARHDSARLDRLAETLRTLDILDPPPSPVTGRSRDEPGDALDHIETAIAHHVESFKKATAHQHQTVAALEANINAVDTPVLATDQSGRVSLLNSAAERLVLKHTSKAIGIPLEDVLTNSALIELHARAEQGVPCRRQIRLTLDGATRFYEVAAIPIRSGIASEPAPRRSGVVLTIKDVHELARTLQLRTDFAANASHELRTPIASLRAAIDTAKGPAQGDPDMRARLLVVLDNNIARLEEIVSDLLDLSHLESEGGPVRTDRFDALEMADALDTMFASACRKRDLTIVFEIDPGLRAMRTDRKLLLLVLRNLIDNATKFAFEHTTIRVTGVPIGSPDPAGGEALLGVRFTVSDRGVGIPLKHQHRVFERFFQVDESRARVGTRRGSGLGLAIVRHAMLRLGGEITVESVWQEGTTMTTEIPRCIEPPASECQTSEDT